MDLTADLGVLLGSPAWTAGATILAAVGLGLTVYLYRKSKSRKRLTYRVAIIELVSVHGDAQDEIQISYGGEVVERVHLIEVSLRNTGNVPIPGSDYEVPFSVGLGEGSKVLSAEVAKVNPPELSPTVEVVNAPNRSSASVGQPEPGEDVITKVKLAHCCSMQGPAVDQDPRQRLRRRSSEPGRVSRRLRNQDLVLGNGDSPEPCHARGSTPRSCLTEAPAWSSSPAGRSPT